MEELSGQLTFLGHVRHITLYPPTFHIKLTNEHGDMFLVEPRELLSLAAWAQAHQKELKVAQKKMEKEQKRAEQLLQASSLEPGEDGK